MAYAANIVGSVRHDGGHSAAHGNAAGAAQGSHGIHGLGCGPLFLAEGLDGFGDPGVGVLRQEDPAGCAVFQGSGDLLAPQASTRRVKQEKLERAMDALQDRYGKTIIGYASRQTQAARAIAGVEEKKEEKP